MLTSLISWRAIFLVNLPVALVAGILIRHVAEPERHRHPLDVIGQTFAVIGLALLTGGFIVAGERGWLAGLTLALLGAGLVAAIAFVLLERVVRHPMIDPALFRRRPFAISVSIGMLFNFCVYGGLFCLSIDFHEVHDLGPFLTGMALLPMSATVGFGAY